MKLTGLGLSLDHAGPLSRPGPTPSVGASTSLSGKDPVSAVQLAEPVGNSARWSNP